MTWLHVRQGDKVEEMGLQALLDAIRLGTIPVAAQVREADQEDWEQAGSFFLKNSRLSPHRDEDSERFLAQHVSGELQQDALIDLLGVKRSNIEVQVHNPSAPPPRPIEQPQIERDSWVQRSHVKTIPLPRWDPDPTEIIVHHISVPAWGAPWRLPAVDQIKVPRWVNPADSTPPLPHLPPVVWRRESSPTVRSDHGSASPRSTPPPPITPPPPKSTSQRSASQRRSEKTQPPHTSLVEAKPRERPTPSPAPSRRPASPPRLKREPRIVRRPPVEPPPTLQRDRSDAKVEGGEGAGVSIKNGIGLFGCFAQLLALIGLLFAVIAVVESGLSELTEIVLPQALSHPELSTQSHPKRALPPFIASGSKKAWLHVVIAPDLTQVEDVEATATLIDALDRVAEAGELPGKGSLRIVLLPRVLHPGQSEALATALSALSRQQHLWRWLRPALKKRQPLGLKSIQEALEDLEVDTDRFNQYRTRSSTLLQVRTWSTMAEALGLGEAFATLNGHPLSRQRILRTADLKTDLARAIALANVAHTKNRDPTRGLEALATALPKQVRQRYIQWILRGERLSNRDPKTKQAGHVPSDPEPPSPVEKTKARENPTHLRSKTAPAAHSRRRRLHVLSSTPSFGPREAPVTFIVFVDFHCPFSKRYAPTLKRLRQTFGDELRIVVMQYPNNALHPKSSEAAALAVAASRSGLFNDAWELLFEWGPKGYDRDLIIQELQRIAAARGQQLKKRTIIRRMRGARRAVSRNRRRGKRWGVTGTPFSFINGLPVRGLRSYDELAAIVRSELKRAQDAAPKAGVPADTPL